MLSFVNIHFVASLQTVFFCLYEDPEESFNDVYVNCNPKHVKTQ